MTTAPGTLEQWARISERYASLDVLKRAIYKGNIREHVPRSLLWRCLLLYGSYNEYNWIANQRRNYDRFEKLRAKYKWTRRLDENDHAIDPDVPVGDDPLSEAPPNTSELMEIVYQDVNRTFPDIELFRDKKIMLVLCEILYCYACLNRPLGYRQGMHELAAPILWVCIQDQIQSDQPAILSAKYTPSDSFGMFEAVMKYAQEWYLPPLNATATPAIVTKAHSIQDNILKLVDKDLYMVLQNQGIEPQIWAIRWIRLLFSREFTFNRTLQLWDCIFAADSTLSVVDFLCVAMLEKIHDRLLVGSATDILTTLLNYPSTPSDDINSLMINALYLKSNLTADGGGNVRANYQQNIAINSVSGANSRNSFNFDVLYDAAKNVGQNLPRFDRRSQEHSSNDMEYLKSQFQTRNALVAQLLSSSITNLQSLHLDENPAKQALDHLRIVQNLLIDIDAPTTELEGILKRMSKTSSQPESSESTAATPSKPVNPTDSGPNSPSKHTKMTFQTPVRASLIQSNFSWMLSSPETRPGSNGCDVFKKSQSSTEADNLFELS